MVTNIFRLKQRGFTQRCFLKCVSLSSVFFKIEFINIFQSFGKGCRRQILNNFPVTNFKIDEIANFFNIRDDYNAGRILLAGSTDIFE